MSADWQNIAVLLIVLAAVLYVGRRGLARLRSFRAGGANDAASSCATGCGGCVTPPATAAQTPRQTLVQIGRADSRR